MEKQTEITDELKDVSPTLASMEKVNVFQIPEDYFSDFDAKILTTIFLQDKKNNFQKVPEGYFNSLSDNILSKIKSENSETPSEEIKAISPALHYLKEEKVFDVPENYFDNLSDRILKKIKPPKTKVISFSSRKWWRYAAAAVVTGVVAISSLQIFNHNSNPVTTDKAIMQLASQYKTPAQIDKGIASLNDEEIVNYLEKNGTILDEETISKNVDTTALPSEDDYLLDENTLNNYLNEINAEANQKTQ
ncbi:MAG TPA: hypothetical protein VN722_09345 [Hanamia sp.]|nr:hypothetical protein [Hanamia sp.]